MVKIVQLSLFTRNNIFVTPRFSPYPSEQQQDALPAPLKSEAATWLALTNGNEHGGTRVAFRSDYIWLPDLILQGTRVDVETHRRAPWTRTTADFAKAEIKPLLL